MEQIIKYYYNINVNNIQSDGMQYFFIYNNKMFYFVVFERNLEDLKYLLNISIDLKKEGIKCHKIISNKFNELISIYKEKKYILISVESNYKVEIDIFDMLKINNKMNLLKNKENGYKNDWKSLWENKVDYYEKQIRGMNNADAFLNTFSYYIGLTECAIEYINKVNKIYKKTEKDKVAICRRRIFAPNYCLNFFNPLSFVMDLEVRDYVEYFKSQLFYGDDIYNQFLGFLKTKKFEDYSYNMMFARLLFPSYYFDLLDNFLAGNYNEKALILIINKVHDYEKFLSFAYSEINKYSHLIAFAWLHNEITE